MPGVADPQQLLTAIKGISRLGCAVAAVCTITERVGAKGLFAVHGLCLVSSVRLHRRLQGPSGGFYEGEMLQFVTGRVDMIWGSWAGAARSALHR
jgi:hypothetical protein